MARAASQQAPSGTEDAERWSTLQDVDAWLHTPMLLLSLMRLLLVIAELTWRSPRALEAFGIAIWSVFVLEFAVRFARSSEARDSSVARDHRRPPAPAQDANAAPGSGSNVLLSAFVTLQTRRRGGRYDRLPRWLRLRWRPQSGRRRSEGVRG
jgi:hypothetical protein